MAQARERIVAGESAREDGGDFVSLSETLGRPVAERLAFYDELAAAGKSAEQRSLVFYMTDDFYEAERFEDYGSTLTLETRLYTIESTPGMLLNMPAEHRARLLNHQVKAQARDIEVLLILGRSNEVKQLFEAMKSLQLDAVCVGYIKDAAGSARKRGATGVPSDAEILDLFSSSEQGDTQGSRKGPNPGS